VTTEPPPLSTVRHWIEWLAIALVGGLCLWSGARFEHAGALLGVGFALLSLPLMSVRWRKPLLLYLVGWMVFIHWINLTLTSHAWFALLIIPTLLLYHYLLYALLVRWLWRLSRWPAWVVLPLAAGTEQLVRPFLGVGDYSMYEAGTFLFALPIAIQIADLVGGLGLTVLWMAVLGAVVEWVRHQWLHEADSSRRNVLRGVAVAIAIISIVLTYGAHRLRSIEFVTGPKLAILQPNLEHKIETTPRVVAQQAQLTQRFVPNNTVQLIVWPENAIFTPMELTPEYRQLVAQLASDKRAAMLVGTQAFGPDGRRPTASVFLIDQSGKQLGRYDKMHLFPFTERRSFAFLEHIWPWLDLKIRELTRIAWGYAPDGWAGQEATVMRFEHQGQSWAFYPPLCYDIAFPAAGRSAVRNGAQFFVNPTSEGWNGWGISNNQLGVSMLRAVENRVGVVRVGNAGPSCFITPDGQVDKWLVGNQYGRRRLDYGVLVHNVKTTQTGPTIYTRYGGLIDLFWPIGWFAALILGWLSRSRAGG
jgi:apolipoprotein N-acyltransferase